MTAPLALVTHALLAAAAASSDVSVALVIGNNAAPPAAVAAASPAVGGAPALSPLRFADDDALRFDALLARLGASVELLSVLDDDTQRRHAGAAARARPPTQAELTGAVARLVDVVRAARAGGATTTAYVFFSGHGSTTADGVPFLALLDAPLTGDALFRDVVDALGADRSHLIVDACNAGAVVGSRGRFDDAPAAERVELDARALEQIARPDALATRPTVGVVLAASAGQETHEWSRIESGVFSHEVLSALLGAADVNSDGRIEYSEVQAFVAAANSRVTDPRARPRIVARAPAIDRRAPLLRLDQLADVAFLRGDFAAFGRFFVELDNGQRHLDAHFAPGARQRVAIPADTGVFLRTESQEVAVRAAPGAEIDVTSLLLSRRALAARGATDASYREHLFAEPYGRTYYVGFVDSAGLLPVDLSGARAVEPGATAPSWGGPQIAAASSWGAAGLLALGAGVAGGLAVATAVEFDRTDVQRDAVELAARYDLLLGVTVAGAGAALAAAGLGLWLWPWSDGADVVEVAAGGGSGG